MNATPVANINSSCDGPPLSPLEDTMGHAHSETLVENFVYMCLALCVTMFCYSLGYALYLWFIDEH